MKGRLLGSVVCIPDRLETVHVISLPDNERVHVQNWTKGKVLVEVYEQIHEEPDVIAVLKGNPANLKVKKVVGEDGELTAEEINAILKIRAEN